MADRTDVLAADQGGQWDAAEGASGGMSQPLRVGGGGLVPLSGGSRRQDKLSERTRTPLILRPHDDPNAPERT